MYIFSQRNCFDEFCISKLNTMITTLLITTVIIVVKHENILLFFGEFSLSTKNSISQYTKVKESLVDMCKNAAKIFKA